MTLAWARVFTRAVVVPAGRRASAAWLGCAIVAAVVFGPTGLQPRDLTGLALHQVGVLATLGLTWILVFAPTARLLVRADAAAYLRSLPAPRWLPIGIVSVALVALQLPWLALWLTGEGVRGLLVFALSTLPILAIAAWRPRAWRVRAPRWRTAGGALLAIYLRALRRRAGDALVRGAGLSLLAGGAAGLFVRNNELVEAEAATVGASVIAVVSVPALVGVALVLATAHRESGWLAASLGISSARRTVSLASAFALVHVGSAMLALVAAFAVIEPSLATAGWLGLTALGVAIATALGAARVVLGAEASPSLAGRTVVGSIVLGAAAVLALSLLGVAGTGALAATCGLLLAIRKDEP